jgi:hypothetical protein
MSLQTDTRIKTAFLALILLQALHSVEEYLFRFYEVFPPARLLNAAIPDIARPGFITFNILLVGFGLFCFFSWVQPAKSQARVAIWCWIAIESYNAIAHVVWAVAARGYNPGLATATVMFPLVAYLLHLARLTERSAAQLKIRTETN